MDTMARSGAPTPVAGQGGSTGAAAPCGSAGRPGGADSGAEGGAATDVCAAAPGATPGWRGVPASPTPGPLASRLARAWADRLTWSGTCGAGGSGAGAAAGDGAADGLGAGSGVSRLAPSRAFWRGSAASASTRAGGCGTGGRFTDMAARAAGAVSPRILRRARQPG